MKKILLIMILLSLFNSNIYSQSGWYQQFCPTISKVSQIFFINEQSGWVCADSLKVFKTTNSGNSWTFTQFPPFHYIPSLNSIYFINDLTGWTVGGDYVLGTQFGYIYKTTNGGNTWVQIFFGLGQCSYVYFINNSTGFTAIDNYYDFEHNGRISMTTNSGVNWFDSDINGYNYGYSKIVFKNNLTGYAIGIKWSDIGIDSSIILKTTNGGFNWFSSFKKRNLQYRSYIHDISAIGNNVWVISRYDSILISTNDGNSWDSKFINSLGSLNKLFFVNENTGWIGKSNINILDTSTLIKSTNGGINWFNISSPFGSISAIYFVNNLTGWSGFPGTINYLMKSVTGGLTGISESNNIASSYSLFQNFPNPFNPKTVISYQLAVNNVVKLNVYDALGNEVVTLVNGKQNVGSYSVEFSGEGLPSGVYFYKLVVSSSNSLVVSSSNQLETGDSVETKRMVLLK